MPEQPVLDPATIATLRDLSPGDDSFLVEIVGIFLNDTPGRVAEMRHGARQGDAKVVARAAHSLKGSSGNFGAAKLQAISKQIEELANAGDLAGAARHFEALEAECAVVARALENLIKPQA
jgi:HPt (histidine-containing phosphotransfer) domain-containing protein